MLYPQEELLQRDNELLVKGFLDAIFSNQYPGHDRNGLFAQALSEQINCWGFPEFNPQNHLEFSGFLNYLHDVFRDSKYCIEPLLADDKNVFTRFHVQGQHSEEFMGLAASGGIIRFTAIGVFKIHNNRINEVLMYNKSVTLTTPKGSVYQLIKAV
ncbi:MAG: ester cyclase [Cellvibrio sp.]|uniref:ester cyclase n=1 Tax=Cellvibrio sp. TaxID=1965322 RepID=UPI0031A49DC7